MFRNRSVTWSELPEYVPVPAAPPDPTFIVNVSPPVTLNTMSEIYAPDAPPGPADSPPAAISLLLYNHLNHLQQLVECE